MACSAAHACSRHPVVARFPQAFRVVRGLLTFWAWLANRWLFNVEGLGLLSPAGGIFGLVFGPETAPSLSRAFAGDNLPVLAMPLQGVGLLAHLKGTVRPAALAGVWPLGIVWAGRQCKL